MKIVARSSPLSRAQVEEVKKLLPSVDFQIRYVDSYGDLDQKTSLRFLGQTDFFTRELDECVLNYQVDAAIHSAKDIPKNLNPNLEIAAITEGLDPRDCIVFSDEIDPKSLKNPLIATSSIHRELAARRLFKNARFKDLRGTIEKRLRELETKEADGVILAEAALIRLNLTHKNRFFLSGKTASLQGRLAILIRKGDTVSRNVFKKIDARGEKKPWTVLYLGLNPIRIRDQIHGRILHYPVIQTKPLEEGMKRLFFLREINHLLFTSKEAVKYFPQEILLRGKKIFAIGEGTKEMLKQRGLNPLVAPFATQEGVFELLKTQDLKGEKIVWPRSKQARNFLLRTDYSIEGVDIYETVFHQPGFSPSLKEIDEIVFMSPSCVRGFLKIYKKIPRDKKLTAYGPITKKALVKNLGET